MTQCIYASTCSISWVVHIVAKMSPCIKRPSFHDVERLQFREARNANANVRTATTAAMVLNSRLDRVTVLLILVSPAIITYKAHDNTEDSNQAVCFTQVTNRRTRTSSNLSLGNLALGVDLLDSHFAIKAFEVVHPNVLGACWCRMAAG